VPALRVIVPALLSCVLPISVSVPLIVMPHETASLVDGKIPG
jgi:hypothetical protein